MSAEIKKYGKNDEKALFALMRSERLEWADYSGSKQAEEKYKIALENSIVYTLYESGTLCGFIRARDDDGYGIYIYDLLVHKKYRGNSYGRLLMDKICSDYPGTVYVMSDVDGYYEKQRFKKEGSIFVVCE